MRFRPCLAAVLLGLTTLVAGCAAEEEAERRPDPPVTVVTQRVATRPETVRVEAIGSARAATSAELYPESAGLVTDVNFDAGDYARRGEPLVELDARRERLAVELAEVAVKEAEQLLARYRRIEDTGALSASQIEAGETALASAQIELQQARVALADRTVRAPFSGHLGITTVDRGDRITPTTRIAQIDDRSTLYVDFAAPEEVFARLRPGQTVTLTPYSNPDRTIEARVRAVDSTVAADQRTFTVRTAVPNAADRLRPGMSFRIGFEDYGRPRTAVPEAAIVWGGEGAYLWAVRDGRARRVPLEIVSRRDGLVLIDANLAENEIIVVEGVQKVREGQAVRQIGREPPEPVRARVAPADARRAAMMVDEGVAPPEGAARGG